MPRNGSGTYSRTNSVFNGSTVWTQDRNAGTAISSTLHDNHDQDIADALTASIAKDGQTTPTANLPMGGFKHTNVANGSARNEYLGIGQCQDGGVLWAGNSAGGANTYNLTLTPAITAYVDGMKFMFRAHQVNTGASTMSINGLTAYNIHKGGGTVRADDINTNTLYTVIYYSSLFYLMTSSLQVHFGYNATSNGGSVSTFSNSHANTGKVDIKAGNLVGGDVRMYTQDILRQSIDYNGNFLFNAGSAGTAGAIAEYWTITFNGVARKIAIYATA